MFMPATNMEHNSTFVNSMITRIAAIIVHALINIIIISRLTDYDLTGSWLSFFGFVLLLLILFFLFIKHLVSVIHFIKNK